MSGGAAGDTVRLVVLGASGRLGRSLIRAIDERPGFELVGALASPRSRALGQDAGEAAGIARRFGTTVVSDRAQAFKRAEVALDFTLPGATLANLDACLARGAALLVGTTALEPAARAALEAAAARIAVLIAPNTSLGINLLARLVAEAAAALPADYDIEVLEAHHRDKRDAPSGTARLLGAAAAQARGVALEDFAAGPRAGPRLPGSIGFAVLRGGDLAGEHSVLYLGAGERLELRHVASDRMSFAYGALKAARWLKGRAPGLYTMREALGLA